MSLPLLTLRAEAASSAPSITAAIAPAQASEIPFAQLCLTGPRGGVREEVISDTRLVAALHGAIVARIILFDPENPNCVALRQGRNGRFGPVGGNLESEDRNPVYCALREGKEESRVLTFPDLRFVTTLTHERYGVWVSLTAWDAWGYERGEHTIRGGKIWIDDMRTAIFCAPLAEPLGRRTVENRIVALIDVEKADLNASIRPMFQDLFAAWPGRHVNPETFPLEMTYRRAAK